MTLMYMTTKEQYLRDPCGSASIPYWKAKSIIVHNSAYQQEAYGGFYEITLNTVAPLHTKIGGY